MNIPISNEMRLQKIVEEFSHKRSLWETRAEFYHVTDALGSADAYCRVLSMIFNLMKEDKTPQQITHEVIQFAKIQQENQPLNQSRYDEAMFNAYSSILHRVENQLWISEP
ncbi:MAG: hypothetical protein H9W81_13570 [Enterococcus sp.]|nr:hypothetical protein [Enterococcus sp.]